MSEGTVDIACRYEFREPQFKEGSFGALTM